MSFKNRSAAEQVISSRFSAIRVPLTLGYFQGLAKGQNIPQVGQVQLSWYSGHASSSKKTNNITSPTVPSMDTKDGSDTGHEPLLTSAGSERHHSPPPQEEEVVASGWGGEEDEDGMGML